jgi:AcrR family transcriptional regulator
MTDVLWGGKGARTQAAKDQKRMLLLETAARLFTEHGFERTTLTDIAKSFSITKPSLYYYVKSKEDILFNISKIALGDLKDAHERTQSGYNCGRDQLAAFLTEYVRVIRSDFGKCLITANKLALSKKSRDILRNDRKSVDYAVRSIITKGVKDGSLVSTSPKFSTFAVFGAMNWMCYWHQEGAEWSNEEIVDRFIEFFLHGLEPRPAENG